MMGQSIQPGCLDGPTLDGAARGLLVDLFGIVEAFLHAAGAHQAADLERMVLGLGLEFAAEVRLRVEPEDREPQLVLKAHDERLVVGDELREERQGEDAEEDPERPECAAVRLEVAPSALAGGT
jgi:hypothetical protein